ncbi:sigma-54 interaction domain-containing protein [Effusibacillus pohliae]|uniref:sigma-54 interaction domain-containing protein n=1 Tax=Effusibacillus pohliae TaxID=232270 RepID=UPI00037529CF|nr:sigma-54-dependent Fis family transcriptional regulator [Effusibacillus pohliae]
MNRLLKIYEHLLEELDEGVHVVDETGKTIIYNRKMAGIESMQKEDVLNKNLLDVFKFPDNQHSTLLQALHEGKSSKNVKQTYFNFKGNEITTVNNTFPIFHENKIIGAVEIAKDVTKMERMLRENILKKGTRYTFDSIIGNSDNFLEVIENAKRAARTSSSILIVGETGTGKELFAQSIHNESSRAAGPFISQNCAALPDTLIESLLFGTKRGAFTGSVDRPGLFEQAEGGTLLLDEINSLSLGLQAKLLRVIQERTVRRIGDTKEKEIDVRIIATINEDPIDMIANNRLRKDLYYRLSVVTLFVPPLRERKQDIPLLVDHFIGKYNRLFQMDVRSASEQVMDLFDSYDWPGNVRELEHVIEGAMNLMGNEPVITFDHLPGHLRRRVNLQPDKAGSAQGLPGTDGEAPSLQKAIRQYEAQYIRQVLAKHNGNITRAAQELNISRQNLQYRLRKYKIR